MVCLAGLRIDYLDRPTARRFVIVRPQETAVSSSKRRGSRSSSVSSRRSASPDESPRKNSKRAASSASRSPSPTKRRSPSPSMVGRASHGPFGSYLSAHDTTNINSINEFIELTEKFHPSSNKGKEATFPVLYPVWFILKSHAYAAQLHFIAGNPSLAKKLLMLPEKSKKTELKLTQRLRLDQERLDGLEKKLRTSVANAASNRKSNPPLQTKFSILIASTQNDQEKSNGKNDSPRAHRSSSDDHEDDESSLSRFVSYLAT